MHVYLYKIKCNLKQVDKTERLTIIDDLSSVHFKDNTDLLNPELIIDLSELSYDEKQKILSSVNYLKIPFTGRFYFVENMTMLTGSFLLLKCHVDVLTTYASKILNTSQMVTRSYKKYDGRYIDENYPVTVEKEITYKHFNKPFNCGSVMTGSNKYIAITVAG